MKWIVLLIFVSLTGCQTSPKKHHVAHHKKTKTSVRKVSVNNTTPRNTTPSEDAAVNAIIKSLREDGDED